MLNQKTSPQNAQLVYNKQTLLKCVDEIGKLLKALPHNMATGEAHDWGKLIIFKRTDRTFHYTWRAAAETEINNKCFLSIPFDLLNVNHNKKIINKLNLDALPAVGRSFKFYLHTLQRILEIQKAAVKHNKAYLSNQSDAIKEQAKQYIDWPHKEFKNKVDAIKKYTAVEMPLVSVTTLYDSQWYGASLEATPAKIELKGLPDNIPRVEVSPFGEQTQYGINVDEPWYEGDTPTQPTDRILSFWERFYGKFSTMEKIEELDQIEKKLKKLGFTK